MGMSGGGQAAARIPNCAGMGTRGVCSLVTQQRSSAATTHCAITQHTGTVPPLWGPPRGMRKQSPPLNHTHLRKHSWQSRTCWQEKKG